MKYRVIHEWQEIHTFYKDIEVEAEGELQARTKVGFAKEEQWGKPVSIDAQMDTDEDTYKIKVECLEE